ncbi:MAG TPA: division/cell wall cluster transcriptional repressor MraZ [Acidimicrobiales bacterium]|nr:division/cell wall cluster transcriptional repressor MraZ [Acidimicrobiales bacterium]
MVVKFFGRYEHALDPKGRVILPAKFRSHFEHGGFLTQYWEGCLALWAPDEFEKQMSSMEESQELGRSQRNLARVWAAGTQDVEIDKQGRLFIAPWLRTFAGLETGVLVNGALNRIELWSPDRWTSKLAATEQILIDDAGEAP